MGDGHRQADLGNHLHSILIAMSSTGCGLCFPVLQNWPQRQFLLQWHWLFGPELSFETLSDGFLTGHFLRSMKPPRTIGKHIPHPVLYVVGSSSASSSSSGECLGDANVKKSKKIWHGKSRPTWWLRADLNYWPTCFSCNLTLVSWSLTPACTNYFNSSSVTSPIGNTQASGSTLSWRCKIIYLVVVLSRETMTSFSKLIKWQCNCLLDKSSANTIQTLSF